LQSKRIVSIWLAASDVCFVHLKKTPLFETVIPSKIFEAAGFSRPILIGVGGDAKKLVETAAAGISVEPENEEQMLSALLQMKEDSKLRRELGENGYRYVSKHFTRDSLSLQYLKILRDQIATHPEIASEPQKEIV
jgi:glycosyltransferase involved in cell wall biosynthesis